MLTEPPLLSEDHGPTSAEVLVPIPVRVRVNGQPHHHDIESRTLLVHFLRDVCGLTGTHVGCETGICGACTVLVDGKAVRSCVTTIGSIGEAQITTIEGLGTIDKPHPIQRAFIDEQAVQCGYCINGMIMSAKALLDANSRPAEGEVRQALAGNLCRCGTNNRIVAAIMRAAQAMGRT
jgi:nicotinate dehydrogenase subunit A